VVIVSILFCISVMCMLAAEFHKVMLQINKKISLANPQLKPKEFKKIKRVTG
jgi:hypothetical protein